MLPGSKRDSLTAQCRKTGHRIGSRIDTNVSDEVASIVDNFRGLRSPYQTDIFRQRDDQTLVTYRVVLGKLTVYSLNSALKLCRRLAGNQIRIQFLPHFLTICRWQRAGVIV